MKLLFYSCQDDSKKAQIYVPKSASKLQKSTKKNSHKRSTLCTESANARTDNANLILNRSFTNNAFQSDNIINTPRTHTSYSNIISPLYSGSNNFKSQRNRRQLNGLTKSNEKTLCLENFIVEKKPTGKKKVQRNLMESNFNNHGVHRQSRRIKPTDVTTQHRRINLEFEKSQNCFKVNNDCAELSPEKLCDQRVKLREERQKILEKKDDLSVTNLTFQSSVGVEIVPDPSSVCCKFQLDILIKLYSFILDSDYLLSYASEVYFLMSLISRQKWYCNRKGGDEVIFECFDKSRNIKHLLDNVHNYSYFAINALRNQRNSLQLFDNPTLRSLAKTRQVIEFHPKFSEDLLHVCTRRLEITCNVAPVAQKNVCFVSDTDNGENFPNMASFHAFIKQRDLFYEILRIWEENHFLTDWNYFVALSGKIRSLLNLHNDPANYRHFTRLFRSQLLTTCGEAEVSLLFIYL